MADSVHGTIRISQLEKSILSTQVFNRLHSVLQNSTAFLTYPANRTSRFSHSLGTMYLCGEMFYHAVSNATPEHLDAFFKDCRIEIQNLFRDSMFQQICRTTLKSHVSLLDTLDHPVAESFYLESTPAAVRNNQWVYTVYYQAVRCVALLHDLGHPPFSHVTEDALRHISDWLGSVSSNANIQSFLQCIDSKAKGHLHESLGNRMASRLLEHVAGIGGKENPTNEDSLERLFGLVVHRIALQILEGSSELHEAIHVLVSGPIDGDRLDYVVRDTQNSGFCSRGIDYLRLVTSMKLIHQDNKFFFCPDIRAMSVIEDFFHLRWHLYKYVIFHHRVRKTDALLRNALVSIAKHHLTNDKTEGRVGGSLPLDISGLWTAIGEMYSDEQYFNAIIQWDDAWLMTVLRKYYYSDYLNSDPTLRSHLEELLANKKKYISLVKRLNDFRAIDRACVEALKRTQGFDEDVILMKPFRAKEKKNPLFLNHVQVTVNEAWDQSFEALIEKAVQNMHQRHNTDPWVLQFNENKAGTTKVPYISCQGMAVPLHEMSSIVEDLSSNGSLFPAFFVYVPECRVDAVQLRLELGEEIATLIAHGSGQPV